MYLFDDYIGEKEFCRWFPFGVPCTIWIDNYGHKIPVKNMSKGYIRHCMQIVGKDDPWYHYFEYELTLRKREV